MGYRKSGQHVRQSIRRALGDTPEAGANLAKAIEHYEKYGPYIPENVKGVTRDPEIMDRIMGVKR